MGGEWGGNIKGNWGDVGDDRGGVDSELGNTGQDRDVASSWLLLGVDMDTGNLVTVIKIRYKYNSLAIHIEVSITLSRSTNYGKSRWDIC